MKGISISYVRLKEDLSLVWTYAFPAFLSSILVTMFIWASNALLVNQPNGYNEMGIISAANQLKLVLAFLPSVVSSVAVPILSSEVVAGRGSFDFPHVMEINHGITVTAIVPVSVLMMMGSKYILSLYGNDFSQGYRILLWIVFGLSISSVGNAAGNGLQALGKMWLGALLKSNMGDCVLTNRDHFCVEIWCVGAVRGDSCCLFCTDNFGVYLFVLGKNSVFENDKASIFGNRLYSPNRDLGLDPE